MGGLDPLADPRWAFGTPGAGCPCMATSPASPSAPSSRRGSCTLARSARVASLALALLACTACSSPTTSGDAFSDAPYATLTTKTQLSVELRTAPSQPPPRGESTAELRIRDVDGGPKDGLTLQVTPWMPAHGHGAPSSPVTTALGGGAYRVDGIELTMPGTWELRIEISSPDGFEDHATARVDVR